MQSAQHVSVNNPDRGDTSLVDPLFVELRAAIAQGLRPKLQSIDVNGEYPEAFMRQVGALGGFKQGTSSELGGTDKGIGWTIQVIEEIARACLSTGFITWCQTVCAWYIQNGESSYLKEQVLPRIITGEILAGTGLSNPMKHFAGIEKIRITAQRCADGYILNGAIPWVSNIGKDHYFAVVAKIVEEDSYLMAVVPGNLPGLSLENGGHFIALEGSSTARCVFKNAFVPTQYILASPCSEFVARVRPGFILTQTGFGLGLVSSCVELMKRTNEAKGHINCFLDDQAESIEIDLHAARQYIYTLADEIGCGEREVRPDIIKEVVKARILASELSLRASQSAMLHAGASGYRLHCIYERKLRESYFVAIVTPALKHLKKMLYELQHNEYEEEG
jgi:alkylation response protein AidB-like acyl-CoA dehydrogenase